LYRSGIDNQAARLHAHECGAGEPEQCVDIRFECAVKFFRRKLFDLLVVIWKAALFIKKSSFPNS